MGLKERDPELYQTLLDVDHNCLQRGEPRFVVLAVDERTGLPDKELMAELGITNVAFEQARCYAWKAVHG